MRRIICEEGVVRDQVAFIEVGGLQFDPEEEYPVIWGFRFGDTNNIMGKASDIRREDDGTIAAELTFNEKSSLIMETDAKAIAFTFYATNVLYKDRNVKHVTSAKLRHVCGVIAGTVPWE